MAYPPTNTLIFPPKPNDWDSGGFELRFVVSIKREKKLCPKN